MGAGTLGHSPDVGGEDEVGIKGDTKKLRGPAGGKSVAVAGHRRVEPGLVCVGGKQGAVLLLTETWRPWSAAHWRASAA